MLLDLEYAVGGVYMEGLVSETAMQVSEMKSPCF